MTKERYNEIRNTPDFLYTYYNECSKIPLERQEFPQLLSVWLSFIVGVEPREGIAQIVSHLDKKFSYKKP